MFKNIQFKIILIFFLIGIIIISGLGISFLNSVELLNFKVENGQVSSEQVETILTTIQQRTSITLIIAGVVFAIIGIIAAIVLSKFVIYPIDKLIKSAERITDEDKAVNKKSLRKKRNHDMGDLENIFGVMTTELKDKLSEVSTQKNQIETILLHMTDGIIAFNMDGNIIHINPAARELLGLNDKDNTFDKVFKKLDIDINMEKIIYLENWTSSEQRKIVGEKCVNILFAPFQDENDRPAGVITLIQDITEHVKLDNMRKEFVADVSHELKTPITSIMGYTETLLETEYDEDTKIKFLNVISSEAKRMARLVTDLLTLSKYDNKKVSAEITSFDLGELVKKCQEKLRFEIEKKHHNVECFVTASVPPVVADKYGIERVVLNILSNAIKYTPENGKIKVYVGFVYNDAYIK